ncbi:MAG: hypothetical protein SH868_09490 [Bythopirellula sp.]|nr:hypothetical protein [Bythopirellula sp.]
MRENNKANKLTWQKTTSDKAELRLLARLRQDQLEAALAGRIAESALYATEAQMLRKELQGELAHSRNLPNDQA